jgi:glycerophosphoryl diester phosphodiesterase
VTPRRAVTAIALLAPSLALSQAGAFDLEGHRGARGLRPENTLAAFSHAMAIGVTTLEMDLAVTKDGVLVISHDPFLNQDLVRGPDGRWLATKGPPIHSLTLADMRILDIGRLDPASLYAKQFPEQQPVDGQRFPTLDEVMTLVKSASRPVHLNIETKITPANPGETVDPSAFARLAVEAIRSSGLAGEVTIESFDWRTLVEAKKLAPEIVTACLTSEASNFDTVGRHAGKSSPWHAGFDLGAVGGSLPRLAKAAGCGIWSPSWRDVTPSQIADAHAVGVTVLPWTVNEPADMGRLIDLGVDGLITDYPDRARKVMAAKGLPLP